MLADVMKCSSPFIQHVFAYYVGIYVAYILLTGSSMHKRVPLHIQLLKFDNDYVVPGPLRLWPP